MAGHDLIETYLAHLRAEVGWRPNADDVVAEASDHLHESVERQVADGVDPVDAQRVALERFGDPDLVATAFATTSTGGVALPTSATLAGGGLAIAAGALWLAFAGLWALAATLESSSGQFEGAPQVAFMLGAASLISAAILTTVVTTTLDSRHGGLGAAGRIGTVLIALGAAAGLVGWFILGWGTAIGLGSLLVGVAMLRLGVAPKWATLAFAGGWSAGLVTFAVLRALEVGSVDRWGDYPTATSASLLVGSTIYATGLIGLGRWLRSEQPADLQPVEPIAAA